MVINLSLFCQVVLGASFLFSFVVNQNWQSALGGSIVALISGFLGLMAVGRQQMTRQRKTITVLEGNIFQLQEYEQQIQDSLDQVIHQHRQVENHTRFLQTELGKLQSNISVQKNYKEQLNAELLNLDQHNRRLEEDTHHWQTKISQLEKQRLNLEMVVKSLSDRKKQVELERDGLEQDIDVIQEFKLQLEAQLTNLEDKIQELESPLGIISPVLESGTPLRNSQLHPQLPREWQEFASRLTAIEIEILQAIAEQNNPNALLKKIAQAEITMPELLIDGINELALSTINDLIIQPGSNPPIIAEIEYIQNLRLLFALK